jgi:2-desacetyl-2-hydroxyethyl bacteriochlorophyllide A dehydrogenase
LTSQTRAVMFTGPRQVEVRDLLVRDPGAEDLLVNALCSGISAGTEMNVFRGVAPQWSHERDAATGLFLAAAPPQWSYPLAYGYACVGRVAEIGPAVPGRAGLSVGDLVYTYTPHAGLAVVHWAEAVRLPPLPDPRAGAFVANLNTALNGVLDARPLIGDVVVVSGLGVIGLLITQLLRRTGAALVVGVDIVERRRQLATRFGADIVMDPSEGSVAERVRALTDNRGADIVIEVSGASAALNEAIRTVGYGAKVVVLSWYGQNLSAVNLAGEFHHNRPRLISSQVGGINPELGPLWPIERRKALATSLLGDLELEPLITHEFPLEEAAKAYALIDEHNDDVVQCLLSYAP